MRSPRAIRTDLAAEARELWRENQGEKEALPGVEVTETVEQGFAVTALRVLDEYGLRDRCVFNCCDCNVVRHLRRDLDLLTVGTADFSPDIVNYAPDAYQWMWAVCVPFDCLSVESARFFHDRGIRYGCVAPEDNLSLAQVCDMDFAVCDDPIPYLRAVGRQPRP